MTKSIRFIRVLCIILCLLSLGLYIGASVQYRRVMDVRGPAITMDSPQITISIQDGEDAIVSGITVRDSSGKDVTSLLTVESLGNFIGPATREASIAAFDWAGNVTKTIRTVVYSDYKPPRVSLSGPLRVPSDSISALLSCITVTDCLDGDISSQVLLTDRSANSENSFSSSQTGEFSMGIQVSNSAGDTLLIPVTVEVYNAADNQARPKLGLSNYLVYVPAGGGSVNPESYLKSLTIGPTSYTYDPIRRCFIRDGTSYSQDTAISFNALRITNPVDTSVPGVYEITYRYTGANSLQETVRLIVIVEE